MYSKEPQRELRQAFIGVFALVGRHRVSSEERALMTRGAGRAE